MINLERTKNINLKNYNTKHIPSGTICGTMYNIANHLGDNSRLEKPMNLNQLY